MSAGPATSCPGGGGYLLGGEWRIGLSLAVGVTIAATMAVQYRDAW
ncbi:hypothetical protein [Nocardioides sp. S5]|nr:hypothetical protein [Nocardioides sp. S5]